MTPTQNKNIEIIREKCVLANPELEDRNMFICDICDGPSFADRPITLADVLFAISIEIELHHEPTRLMMRRGFGIEKEPTDWVSWNLRKDSLTEQSPETLQFLADLLS